MGLGYGDLAAEVGFEVVLYIGGVLEVAEEVHHFGYSGFEGHVEPVGYADVFKVAAGFVAAELNGAYLALGYIEDDLAALYGGLQEVDKPGVGSGVAGAEGFHHDAAHFGR